MLVQEGGPFTGYTNQVCMGAPKHTYSSQQEHLKKGRGDSTQSHHASVLKPSVGVAARVLGLANQGGRNICCPIRASGTSGTNEQQYI